MLPVLAVHCVLDNLCCQSRDNSCSSFESGSLARKLTVTMTSTITMRAILAVQLSTVVPLQNDIGYVICHLEVRQSWMPVSLTILAVHLSAISLHCALNRSEHKMTLSMPPFAMKERGSLTMSPSSQYGYRPEVAVRQCDHEPNGSGQGGVQANAPLHKIHPANPPTTCHCRFGIIAPGHCLLLLTRWQHYDNV